MTKNNARYSSEISATEFKKHFLSLVDEVKNQHTSFVITKRKLPVAKILPLDKTSDPQCKSYFGYMKGIVTIKSDIVNFSSESDWEETNV